MTIIELTGGIVEIYDSPYSLPELQRIEHDYYSLIHANIGSSMLDIDQHFLPLMTLIGTPDVEAQVDAVNNLRYLLFNIQNKQIGPKPLAFACLVKSVNGDDWKDYTEEGVNKLADVLSTMGLTNDVIADQLPELEKKF